MPMGIYPHREYSDLDPSSQRLEAHAELLGLASCWAGGYIRVVGYIPKFEVLMNITVTVARDGEAEVWYVEDGNVPGLSTGADTPDELVEKLKVAIPELLAENGVPFEADRFKVQASIAA
jgi:hypothetical protein